MSTEVQTVPEDNEVEAKKRSAWGTLGVAVHKSEMQLQAQAQDLILKVSKLPTKPDEVAEAEATYKECRSLAVVLQNDRKNITSKFDDVSARLMAPEKSLVEPFLKLSTAIIEVKKADEARVKSLNAKAEEEKTVRKYILDAIATIESAHRTKISQRAQDAYANALGAANIAPAAIADYILRCKAGLKEEHFGFVIPVPALKLLSSDEYGTILFSIAMPTPTEYRKLWFEELDKKFFDYTIAYANKEQAIALSKKEAEAAAAAEVENLENQKAASTLEAVATTAVVSTEMKALKKVFKIKMDETPENAILIIHVVVKNWVKTKDKIRVKKWFKFSVENAIVALEAVKNEDNEFNATGITFVEESKL